MNLQTCVKGWKKVSNPFLLYLVEDLIVRVCSIRDNMRKGIKLGIIGAIIIIVGVSAFYLASPLFISTEINKPVLKRS